MSSVHVVCKCPKDFHLLEDGKTCSSKIKKDNITYVGKIRQKCSLEMFLLTKVALFSSLFLICP